MPQYNWNIVESGVKQHNFCLKTGLTINLKVSKKYRQKRHYRTNLWLSIFLIVSESFVVHRVEQTEGLNPIWLPCLTFSCNTVNDHWFGKINHYPFSLLVLSCHPATCWWPLIGISQVWPLRSWIGSPWGGYRHLIILHG